MTLRINRILPLICILIFLGSALSTVCLGQETDEIYMDFYYESTCSTCQEKLDLIQSTYVNNEAYSDVTVTILDMISNETARDKWENISVEAFGYTIYPLLVLRNDEFTAFPIDEFHMTKKLIDENISNIRNGIYKQNDRENIISTPWGDFDVSNWSIPILTIVLGGLDSFNPCAFFILIFLLNLLIYAKSRKRMVLIGGIFIFFSGFLYMLFMFLLYEFLQTIKTTENIFIVTILVGIIVLPMGLLNIKDFFFFKKGASLSIPEDKKPKIYKQMRRLVKNQSLTGTIIGTIVLAATVNFYELLCTLGLPFAFINQLSSQHSITGESLSYYMYILLYNVVYVIPLIIIVGIFVLTLGKRKLTEWHGQIMKLVSGIMLSGFGIIFLVDYMILENPVTPILLLLMSLILTAVIAFFWKRFVGIPDESSKQ